jgi:Mrp family chromosome partitioning ATPase
MIIERALEKLKQGGTPATPASSQPTRSASMIAANKRTAAVQHAPESAGRPTFPICDVDGQATEANRVLVPGTPLEQSSGVAAAYRIIRTRLLQRMRTNNWSTLAITSPGAGEGKSVTALNVALNVARERTCDVFLIDLDMRNPSVCRYLGIQPRVELIDFFGGQGAPADVFFSIGPSNLAIAGSTAATEAASELLASGRFEELISYIASISHNPLVLIDLPPVLVTDEALLVAPRVDATLLVVAEGRTRREGLIRARQVLADFNLVGVVLNRSSDNLGIDSYYGYGYRYGEPSR